MPITSWPPLGDTINAEDLTDRLKKIETFVNLDIDGPADFEDDGVEKFETKHIYKPDLFGSPSPRQMAISSQTHWRNTDNDWTSGVIFQGGTVGNSWVPIPGLCTRVKLTQACDVHVSASFYCFEMGGVTDAHSERKWVKGVENEGGAGKLVSAGGRLRDSTLSASNYGHEYELAGNVQLMLDGATVSSTNRKIFTSNVYPVNGKNECINGGHIMFQMLSRHHQSICRSFQRNKGWHDIGIAFQPSETDLIALQGTAPANASGVWAQQHKHVYFLARSLVVDCVYRD